MSIFFVVHGAIGCGQKRFTLVWRCQPLLSGFLANFLFRSWSHRLRPKKLHSSVAVPAAPVRVPSQRPLAPSVASVTSVANDKGDPGAVHRSPGICFTAEENPKKPQLGDRLMKGLCDQSSPQMGSLSSK